MEQGWIKLHRKLRENPIYTSGDSYLIQLWIHLLLSVNHKEKRFLFNGEEFIIKEGQGIFGLNQITKNLTNLKNEKTKRFKKFKTIYYRRLKILKKLKNVKLQPTNKFTIITVLKWDEYQQNETQVKLNRNSSETQVKTNKNDKNVKNDKTVDFSLFWEKYDKKVSKSKAVKKWNSLSLTEKKAILEYIPAYVESTPDKQFRKNPMTFFNNESWKDELELPKINKYSC